MRSIDWYRKKFEENGNICDFDMICPHCFEANCEDSLDLCVNGDIERNVKCENCGEDMDVQVEITKRFTTIKSKIYN